MRVEQLAEKMMQNLGVAGAWARERERLLIEVGRVYAAGWRDGAAYVGIGLLVMALLSVLFILGFL